MSRSLRPLLLFLAAFVVVVLWVGRPDLSGSHEARVAQVARQMAASGSPLHPTPVAVPRVSVGKLPDGSLRLLPSRDETLEVNPWLIPVYRGEIRLQKPPLPAWCAAACFAVLGVSEFSARLVPAILGGAAVLIVWSLATQLLGRRGGWLAAWVFLSSYFVPQEYRKLMADPFLAFFTLTCVWAWVIASRRQTEFWHLLFYVSLGLGAMAKGPALFVHVGIALIAYHICYRRPLPRLWISHAAGLLVFAAIALPWPAYVLRHVPGAMDIWRYESVGELGENTENPRPFWFYLPDLFNLAFPWTPLWLASLVHPFLRRQRRLFFAWGWCVATVVFFSFVNLKKDAYLLPMMPAMALMVAPVLRRLLAMSRRPKARELWKTLAIIQAICGIAAAGMLIWYTRSSVIACVMAGVVVVLSLLAPIRPRRWLVMQVTAYLLLAAVYVSVYRALDGARSPRDFAPTMLGIAEKRDKPLLVSEGTGFYLPLDAPLWRGEPRFLLPVPPGTKTPAKWDKWVSEKARGRGVQEVSEIPVASKTGWRLLEVQLASRSASQK